MESNGGASHLSERHLGWGSWELGRAWVHDCEELLFLEGVALAGPDMQASDCHRATGTMGSLEQFA